jgi:hypothetical protein
MNAIIALARVHGRNLEFLVNNFEIENNIIRFTEKF